ncbi:MAG TPA: single-stranded DNA-binding protein [Phycisphaerae bacterium]|nr:single-stranded DNA-binding protein [Phycisphaerae bacterium]HRR87291.1 single-stranded DNA-binding protein [Phycisphaerae bacterium]
MASFNRVILAGNLTRDPQLSYTPNNTAVCEFGLAVNRRWRDRDGNQKDEVCFVDVTSYGRQAETINQYMKKGSGILIEGRLRFRQWTSKEGQSRNKLDVVVENFTFLGSGAGAAGRPADRPAASVVEEGPPPDDFGPPVENPDIPF